MKLEHDPKLSPGASGAAIDPGREAVAGYR